MTDVTLNVKHKAHLVMMYARGILTVSGIVSLSVFIAAAMEDEGGTPLVSLVAVLSLMKLCVTGVTVFVKNRLFPDGDRIFFYVNLGLSPRRMTVAAVLLDLAVYAVVLTLIIVIKNALLY